MVLVGVPDVEDLLVQLPPDIVKPLVVILPGQLEQGVVLVHLGKWYRVVLSGTNWYCVVLSGTGTWCY